MPTKENKIENDFIDKLKELKYNYRPAVVKLNRDG